MNSSIWGLCVLPAAAAITAVLLVAGPIVVVLVPIAREKREARWQTYAPRCEASRFTEQQCRLLFDNAAPMTKPFRRPSTPRLSL